MTGGRIRLVAANAPMGPTTKTSDFYGGVFKVTQPASGAGRVDLKLTGPLAHVHEVHEPVGARGGVEVESARASPRRGSCGATAMGRSGRSGSAAQRPSAAPTGRSSTAATDRRSSSSHAGSSPSTDNVKHKTVLVKAGHSYLIRKHR